MRGAKRCASGCKRLVRRSESREPRSGRSERSIFLGFLIQWPTILTVLMAPILVRSYARLARREEEELETFFGEELAICLRRLPWRHATRLGEIDQGDLPGRLN